VAPEQLDLGVEYNLTELSEGIEYSLISDVTFAQVAIYRLEFSGFRMLFC